MGWPIVAGMGCRSQLAESGLAAARLERVASLRLAVFPSLGALRQRRHATPHQREVDLHDLHLAADAVEQRDAQLAAEVLAELLQRLFDVEPRQRPMVELEADVLEGVEQLAELDLADHPLVEGIERVERAADRHRLAVAQ